MCHMDDEQSRLGLSVGCFVGVFVVGDADGDAWGDSLGVSVEGEVVGCGGVGESDGGEVGERLGFSVGSKVVGDSEGSGLGAGDVSHSSSAFQGWLAQHASIVSYSASHLLIPPHGAAPTQDWTQWPVDRKMYHGSSVVGLRVGWRVGLGACVLGFAVGGGVVGLDEGGTRSSPPSGHIL